MALDPSIYSKIGQGVTPLQNTNPLLMQQQVAQTGNALIQGQQLRNQLSGSNAWAQAYQSATLDPTTGLPNSSDLLTNLQQMPGGGYALPDAIKGTQAMQQGQYGLNKAQLEQTAARTNIVNSALTPLVRMGQNVGLQDIAGTIAGLHASGFPTDQIVADAATTLPTQQPGQSSVQYGQQLQAWVLNHAARSWDPGTQSAAFTPRIGMQDTGGQIVPTDTNAYTNPGILNGAPINRTLSPGEQVAQVPGPVGAGGQRTVLPQGGYAKGAGYGNLVPGGQPAPSPFQNGGRLNVPAALRNPAAQGGGLGNAPAPGSVGAGSPGYAPAQPSSGSLPQSVPAAAMPPPGTPMPVSLSPSTQAGLDASGKSSADQWAALQGSVGGSGNRIYQLQTAAQELGALGQTGTGPSAKTLNGIRSYLQSLPLIGQHIPGVDADQIANYDQANKALTAYAAAKAGAHGGNTDSQLATTLSSNASTHISNLAAQNVVKANIGLERMDQAQIDGFQQGLDPVSGQPGRTRLTPDQFSDYSAQWNRSMDPRAFIADQLTAKQFTATVQRMQPAERLRFQNTYNLAVKNGWIDQPAWATPAPAATPAAAPAVRGY